MKTRGLVLYGVGCLTVVFLTFFYAFFLEERVAAVLNIAHEFRSSTDRWEYVGTVAFFSALGFLTPVYLSRRFQAELQAEEERYRSIFNTVPDAIISIDAHETVVEWNGAAERLLGFPKATILGLPLEPIVPARYQSVHTRKTRQAFVTERLESGGRPLGIVARRADGREFPAEVTLAFRTVAGRQLLTGVLRDISDRKAVEEQLRSRNSLLQSVLEAIPYPFYVVEVASFNVVLANSAAQRAGIHPASSGKCHRWLHDLSEPCSGEGHSCPLPAILKTGLPQMVEHVHRDASGETRYYELHGYPIDNAEGKIEQIAECSIEITARRRAEQELIHLNANLEEEVQKRSVQLEAAQSNLIRAEKLAAIGRLAATVRHDLRNPLGVISNSVYYLQQCLPESEGKIEKHLRILREQVERFDSIIGELLDFSKEIHLDLELTDLRDVLAATLRNLQVPSRVQLQTRFAAGLPLLPLDPRQLQRVFHNLTINALQAMPEGGTLVITAREIPEGPVEVVFEDSGVGVPPEDRAKIFDPLYTTKRDGTGLGLVIVREIVERHGGQVGVTAPETGPGARFTLTLPVSPITE